MIQQRRRRRDNLIYALVRCSTVLGAASGRSLSVICPKVVLTLTVDISTDVIDAFLAALWLESMRLAKAPGYNS